MSPLFMFALLTQKKDVVPSCGNEDKIQELINEATLQITDKPSKNSSKTF